MDRNSLAHTTWNCKYHIMIFDRHANLKYKYGNRQFWCKGYYVDTVGRNKKELKKPPF